MLFIDIKTIHYVQKKTLSANSSDFSVKFFLTGQ